MKIQKGNDFRKDPFAGIEKMIKEMAKVHKKMAKRGLHNIGCCCLCGSTHYTDDPILKSPQGQ
jgi:tRNA G46 methylase TrmB